MAQPKTQVLSFHDLHGWDHDNQGAALAAFLSTCPLRADHQNQASPIAAILTLIMDHFSGGRP
ncbi:MAG: hypothetical protein PF443_06605, partial [Allgaiera sp.]|nr:hypothetical protein [Allgaiera sp.]